MDELEAQVRQRILTKSVEGLSQVISTPENQSKLMELLTSLLYEVIDQIGVEENLNEEMREELKSDFEEEFIPQIKSMYSDPFLLRATLYTQLSKYNLPSTELDELMSKTVDELRDLEVDKNFIEEHEGYIKELSGYLRLSDDLVETLVDAAKKEGLEKATEEESIYRATRELFPTAQEYKDHSIGVRQITSKILQNTQGLLTNDDELGVLGDALGKYLQEVGEVMIPLMEEYTNQLVQKIYGESSVL